MRIPVYRSSVPYRRAYAQDVALARPSLEGSGKKEWTDLQTAAGVMQGIYALPAALNRTLDAFAESGAAWGEEWKRLKKESENISSGGNKTESAAEKNFSSPLRMQQLQYAREKIFEPALSEQEAENPVQRLDEYVSQNFRQADAEGLPAQDYVILRREVASLSQKRRQMQARENLQKGETAFIQTAALVRSPRALEAYIGGNVSAARSAGRAAGLNEEQLRARGRALRAQAVRHNVEAALEAAETAQAEAVYAHFASKINEREKTLLRRKITARKADLLGEALWLQARETCVDGRGVPSEEKLRLFVRAAANGEEENFAQDLEEALKTRLAQDRRSGLHRKAEAYQNLARAPEGADITPLLRTACFNEEEFAHAQTVLRLQQQNPKQTSSAAVFYDLHEKLLSGALQEKELAAALEEGRLSASDYWRLQARRAAAQADGAPLESQLLARALARFCRQNGLDKNEGAQVHYFVFTAGETAEEQLCAARRVRQLFLLQENKQ